MTANPERERTYGQWWDWNGEFATVPIAALRALCNAAFEAGGAAADDAAFLAGNLLDKTLQGDHARGIVYLPALVRSAVRGESSLAPSVRIVRSKGATAVIDAGEGIPSRPDDLVCAAAMRMAIERAREFGVGVVSAQSSCRVLTPIVRLAAEAGMVGVTFTQSAPSVAPLGGRGPLLGNAPTAIAIPSGDRDPIILDMSITDTSSSGVLLAARQDQEVPPGMLLDRDGEPTTAARDLFDGDLEGTSGHVTLQGSLTPLGGGHKGYALVYTIGLLASLLTDTSPAWELAAQVAEPGTWGSVHLAIDVNALNPNDPDGHVARFVDTVAGSPRRAGVDEILHPGQKSQRLRREREEAGTVDVPRPQIEALVAVADELGIEVPAALLSFRPPA